MQINTVNEQDAYDKGFADGKDYWVPIEQERIIALLEKRKCPCYCEVHMVLDPAIESIKGEGK